MCILWENLISKAPFYYKMTFSKHYKKNVLRKYLPYLSASLQLSEYQQYKD